MLFRSGLLIVSALGVVDAEEIANPYRSVEIPGLLVGVTRAKGAKCPRCWIYSEDAGKDAAHPLLCQRCLGNL